MLKKEFPVGATVEVVSEGSSLFGLVGKVVKHYQSDYQLEVRFDADAVKNKLEDENFWNYPYEFLFTSKELKVLVIW